MKKNECTLFDVLKDKKKVKAFYVVANFYDHFEDQQQVIEDFYEIAVFLQTNKKFLNASNRRRSNILYALKLFSNFTTTVYKLIGKDAQDYIKVLEN